MNKISKKSGTLIILSVLVNLFACPTLKAEERSKEPTVSQEKMLEQDSNDNIILTKDAKKFIDRYENKFSKGSDGKDITETTFVLTQEGEDLMKNSPNQFNDKLKVALSNLEYYGFYPEQTNIKVTLLDKNNEQLRFYDLVSGDYALKDKSGTDSLQHKNPNSMPQTQQQDRGVIKK
jgi:hypothetical protein